MADEDDKIGLKAEIDVAMVEAAAAAYAKAVAKMEDQTDSSGDAMTSSFDAVERAWNSMSSGIDAGKEIITGALRKVGEIAVGALGDAASALWDFAKDSLAGALDAQKGLDELNATIEHLGDAAPITSDRALELADQFKNLAGGSDDAVLAAEKVLLRFDKIGGDAFPRVLEQSADIATLFGGDMASGAEVLGKILQDISTDGVGSIGKLKAAGVQLTDAQEMQILAMVKAGDVAGAQNAVLDALAETTGGAAAAASETLAGKWDIFKESIADAGEGIALSLMPGLTELADAVLPQVLSLVEAGAPVFTAIAEAVSDFVSGILTGEDPIGNLANLVYGVANALGLDGTGLYGAVIQLREPFDALMLGIADLSSTFGGFFANLAEGDLETAFEYLGESSVLQDLFKALGTDVSTVTGAIGGFVEDVQANLPIVQAAFADAWAAIQPALTELWSVITTEVLPAIGSLKTDVDVQLPTIKQIFEVVAAAITIAARGFTDFLTNVAIPVIRSVTDFVVANWPTIQATIETVMAAVGDVIDTVLQGAQDFWHEWGDDIQKFTDTMFAAVKDIFSAFSKAFSGDWEGFGEDLRAAWDKIWEAIQESAQTSIDAILAIDWGSVGDGIAKGIAAGLDAALQWVVDAAVNIAKAALAAAKGFLGIESPSKEFAWVGEMSGLGFVKGLESMVPHMYTATKDAFKSLPAAALEGLPVMADRVLSPMASLIEDVFGSLSGAAAASANLALDKLGTPILESTMPVTLAGTGVAPHSASVRNTTYNYYYSPSYAATPNSPQLDFALMRVFNGA